MSSRPASDELNKEHNSAGVSLFPFLQPQVIGHNGRIEEATKTPENRDMWRQ